MSFIESVANKQHPMCVLYRKTLSNVAMKSNRLRKHFSKKHPNDKDKPIEYFQEKYKKIQNRSTVVVISLKKQSAANEDGLIAAYRIMQLIEKMVKTIIFEKL
ncbi:hypothetical protein CDAR_293181 [Caerostris darwini]|uniref:GIY-YIG homing endonuclease n=1 Tax=Caerostris darwini TaxID=1538125 RepID=A0AAV4QLH1_9ARAC|nr:hypothetical protein CDAR_293181 [Caerostris darwini]